MNTEKERLIKKSETIAKDLFGELMEFMDEWENNPYPIRELKHNYHRRFFTLKVFCHMPVMKIVKLHFGLMPWDFWRLLNKLMKNLEKKSQNEVLHYLFVREELAYGDFVRAVVTMLNN